jgi:hypothetical protein
MELDQIERGVLNPEAKGESWFYMTTFAQQQRIEYVLHW